MIEINKINARIYSKLGQSGALFGVGLFEALKKHNEIFVLSSDMSRPAGLDRFKSLYPNLFYNVGIAEQNLIGMAAGLASEGKKVVVTAQAAFLSMRSFEQVRQYMGYMQNNIVAVGISSGFALNFFGNSHYSIEDIALMRAIPGMSVFSPCDAGQAAKLLELALDLNSPSYIRLTGTLNCPIVYSEDYAPEPDKPIVVKEGSDITIFATGSMVFNALEASRILNKNGISARVVDIFAIKPLNTDVLRRYTSANLFVSVEEHSVIGGLGSAISEFLSSQKNKVPRLLNLGIRDCFSHPGSYEYLLEENRLSPALIAEDILSNYTF